MSRAFCFLFNQSAHDAFLNCGNDGRCVDDFYHAVNVIGFGFKLQQLIQNF